MFKSDWCFAMQNTFWILVFYKPYTIRKLCNTVRLVGLENSHLAYVCCLVFRFNSIIKLFFCSCLLCSAAGAKKEKKSKINSKRLKHIVFFILDLYPSSHRQRLLLHKIYANWYIRLVAIIAHRIIQKPKWRSKQTKAKEKWICATTIKRRKKSRKLEMKSNPQSRLHVMHVFKWHFDIPELLFDVCAFYMWKRAK